MIEGGAPGVGPAGADAGSEIEGVAQMSMRIAIGTAAVGVALAVVGAGMAAGAGQGRQDVSPAIGPLGEATPRSKAAQRIASLLRDGVEVDVPKLIAELPKPEELARRRSEIAEQMMEFALVKFVQPPSPTAERGVFHAAIVDYVEWSSKRLDATLELAGSDDDRRNALGREVAKLRGVEEVYRELSQTEGIGISPQNLMELEFLRLEMESRLVKLGAGES
jgi:hypothetical protein